MQMFNILSIHLPNKEIRPLSLQLSSPDLQTYSILVFETILGEAKLLLALNLVIKTCFYLGDVQHKQFLHGQMGLFLVCFRPLFLWWIL